MKWIPRSHIDMWDPSEPVLRSFLHRKGSITTKITVIEEHIHGYNRTGDQRNNQK